MFAFATCGHLRELAFEELKSRRRGAVVHPREQAEREHVLRALGFLLRDLAVFQCLDRHRGERHSGDAVLGQACRLRAGCRCSRCAGRRATVNSSALAMMSAPSGRSAMLALSAAGFIATSTFGASPGVMMSWSAKCSWNDETPGQRAGGCPDLGREVRQRRQVVAEGGGLGGEAVAGELHAVAGVAGEPDDHPVELLDLLARGRP